MTATGTEMFGPPRRSWSGSAAAEKIAGSFDEATKLALEEQAVAC
jgi:hypothetical protein